MSTGEGLKIKINTENSTGRLKTGTEMSTDRLAGTEISSERLRSGNEISTEKFRTGTKMSTEKLATPKHFRSEHKDLWTLALEERQSDEDKRIGNSELLGSEDNTTHVLFIGSQNSGKTTIILRFLDREEVPKPTTALEYTFGRRSTGTNMAKNVSHLWELGGGTFMSKMVQVPITLENISLMSVVLVVDLSKPEEIWVTLELFIKEVRTHVKSLLAEMKSDQVNNLMKKAWKIFGDDHPDKELLDPCPIPLVIIGSKYDIYQDFDPEKKKIISKTLRFIAHTNGASLQYISHKSDLMMSKIKQLINHLTFGSPLNHTAYMDYTKPLLVPAGSDTLGQIGIPSISSGELGKINARNPLELWKQAYCGFFPQVSVQSELGADPCKDTKYKETAVDAMRLQKDDDLERYRRECERKARESARRRGEVHVSNKT